MNGTSQSYESPPGIKNILGDWIYYNNGTSPRFRIFSTVKEIEKGILTDP